MPFSRKLRMSNTGGLQMMNKANDGGNEVGIRFTKHALDRFRQRVVPILPEHTRVKYRKYSQIKRLIKRARLFTDDIHQAEGDLIKVDAFLTIDGYPPVPLTFVLNAVSNVIVTLYTQGGWEITTQSGKMFWRWLN